MLEAEDRMAVIETTLQTKELEIKQLEKVRHQADID